MRADYGSQSSRIEGHYLTWNAWRSVFVILKKKAPTNNQQDDEFSSEIISRYETKFADNLFRDLIAGRPSQCI